MSLNNPPSGPNWAEFAISALPWVTSSVANGIVRHDFGDRTLSGSIADFNFISKWVIVHNADATKSLTIGFTRRGLETTNNNFSIAAGQSFSADLRISSIWLSGSGTSYEVIAGLTGIPSTMLPVLSASRGNPGVG